ncbi:MAG: tetratricopeptide repeat protein [candidate division Zixibacteria bacterium]|nr:tetratricopeptide repeat protein [candidate division Zixibacteria bacterium]
MANCFLLNLAKVMMKKGFKSVLVVTAISLAVSATPSWSADLKPGIEAYKNGNYDQAIELISSYLQEKPRDETGFYYLGNCYLEKGELDRAIQQYQRALELKSKYWEAYAQLGHAYYKKGMYDQAEETVRKGLDKKEKGELWNVLGLVQMAKGMLKEADFSFRKAISFDDENPEYHKNLGDVNFNKGVLIIAMQEYQTALGLDSTKVEVYFNLAQAYLKQARFNDAMDAFKTAIRVDPENKEAYLALGEIYMLDGKHYPEARIIYEEYLKFGEQNSEALKNLGISYYYLSKILPSLVVNGDTLTREAMADRASQYLERSLSSSTDEPDVYLYLGEAYQDLRKFPEALNAFSSYEQAMIEQDYEWTEKDADFWISKGQVLAEIGDPASLQQAIASLKKGIELDSTKTAAYSTLGKALYDQGEYKKAIPFFRKRIESDPDNATAHLNLAFSYLKLEMYSEAVDPLTKVVQLKPDNKNAHDLLARVYLNLNKFGAAKDHYLKVIQLDPSDCEVNRNVGYCYMRLNDPGSAVPYYRKVVSCYPGDVTDLLNLAQALELSGNIDEAYEYYLKVLEIDPKNKQAIDGRDRIDMQRY